MNEKESTSPGGLLSLHQLVKRGRYTVSGLRDEHGNPQPTVVCNEHLDKYFDKSPYGGGLDDGDLDIVEILAWIENHEGEHHAEPVDLKVTVPLTQIMTAYAQQLGVDPREMFHEQFPPDDQITGYPDHYIINGTHSGCCDLEPEKGE